MNERVLILGLGNELLCDDAAGPVLAQLVYDRLPEGTAELLISDLGGMSLMHALEGFDRAIIIDSIQSWEYKPGECLRTSPEGRAVSRRMMGLHDTSLYNALRVGESLNLHLPQNVIIYLINGVDLHTFSDSMTPEVEERLPSAAQRILEEEFGMED